MPYLPVRATSLLSEKIRPDSFFRKESVTTQTKLDLIKNEFLMDKIEYIFLHTSVGRDEVKVIKKMQQQKMKLIFHQMMFQWQTVAAATATTIAILMIIIMIIAMMV